MPRCRTSSATEAACPCALGLSVPLSVAAGLGAVARQGVVFRDGGQLLALADVDTLVMDKTGTVTEGVPAVVEASDEALRLAGALERASWFNVCVSECVCVRCVCACLFVRLCVCVCLALFTFFFVCECVYAVCACLRV